MSIEGLISLSERLPKLFKLNLEILNRLIEMIFYQMIFINEEITEEWTNPPNGFNDSIENDEEYDSIRFGMHSIDRILTNIDDKQVLLFISEMVQKMFQHNDWRYQHAAIMVLSQVMNIIKFF